MFIDSLILKIPHPPKKTPNKTTTKNPTPQKKSELQVTWTKM